jgi:acetyltransferase-like isoleucine patch superfamily enzyme
VTQPVVLEHDWFPCPLPANVLHGERSWLYSSYAFIHCRSRRPVGVRIGHDTGVYIETFFDLGPEGEVEIGDYCTIAGPIFSTNGRVVIGDYALISREVVLADSFAALPAGACDQPRVHADAAAAGIHIGNDVWIGTRAVLLSGAQLADGVIVGAGAVVDFAVPAYAIVAGNPGRVVGWARPQRLASPQKQVKQRI